MSVFNGLTTEDGAVKTYSLVSAGNPAGTTQVNGVALPIPYKAVVDGAILVRFV